MFTATRLAKTVAFAALIATTAATAVPAWAADQIDTPATGELNVANVDFTSAPAVASLKLRAERLARQVCYGQFTNDGLPSAEERECFRAAVARSFAAIDTRVQLALAAAGTRVAANAPATAAAKPGR